MGFYQQMRNTYGREAVAELRRFSHNQLKIASLSNRRIFLLSCRRRNLLPRHITDRISNLQGIFEYRDGQTGRRIQDFYHRLGHRILCMEISITIKNLSYLQQCQLNLETQIKNIFPLEIWTEFRQRSQINYNRQFSKIKTSNVSNLSRLQRSQGEEIKVSSRWFKNISQLQFPKEIYDFLSLGPKFSIAPSKRDISIPRILAEIESINVDPTLSNKTLVSAKVTNILTNFLQKQDVGVPKHLDIFNKTRKFLRDHPEVVITPADKGGTTVAMDREQYFNLSYDILSDLDYYQPLQRDPTSTIQQKANKIVSELKRDNKIDADIARTLTIYNSVASKFYGLPKVHKPTLSLRPIISSIDSPNSKIAHFVTDILTKAYSKENRYYISDSFQFSSIVNDMHIPDDHVIASFDVVSLFTNIPLDLVLRSIGNRWDTIKNFCTLDLNRFIELIKFVFDTTFFSFDGKFFKQIFGTPMGSVISPIISLYVMDDLLDIALNRLPYQMFLIKKYVDDIICVLPSNQLDITLDIFNGVHDKIKFTIEKENNDFSVPFLDTLVMRFGDCIRTDWYTKPTSSGRYVNYHSYHTTKVKINTVLNMRNRVVQVSHPSFHRKNLNKLFEIMLQNSFPPALLKKLIYSTPTQRNTENNVTEVQPSQTVVYRSLPYVRNLTESLISVLSQINGLKIAVKNQKSIKSLFTRKKDSTPILQQSGVVYSLRCQGCSSVYVGQTSRNLSSRITSHRSDIRRNISSCALAKHVCDTGHTVDYQNPKVLDIEKNYRKRTFLEMVRIAQTNDSMNYRRDIQGLSNVYTFLLELDKQRGNDVPPDRDRENLTLSPI